MTQAAVEDREVDAPACFDVSDPGDVNSRLGYEKPPRLDDKAGLAGVLAGTTRSTRVGKPI